MKFLTPIFALVFLVLLILNVKYMLSNPFVADTKQSESIRRNHFAFFLPEADSVFFEEVKKGADYAAQLMDCSISYHPIDKDPLSLEMARYTGIDGLIVYPYQKDDKLLASMEQIYDSGIPIVQIENQAMIKPKSVFIGTNSFDFGKAIGRLALRTEMENLRIALVYSDRNPGLMAYGSLLEMGMKSILGRRISVLRSYQTSQYQLDAEKLAYELIQSNDAYTLIVFTDTNDTLVAVQAMIDMNLVGSVQIIGFGNDPVINAYINKGVVLGSIVRDAYNIGFNAVSALTEIKKSGNTSAYVDTGISIIDKETNPPQPHGGAR
jgi:ribose transport system substrate-binding protein